MSKINDDVRKNIERFLKESCEDLMKNEPDVLKRSVKMDVYFNLMKILDNYDELTPLLMDFFAKKANQNKYREEDR